MAMKTTERHRKERALVRSMGMGASLAAACATVGIERSTFGEWVAEDAVFADEVRVSRMEALEGIMWSLRLLATGQMVEEEKVVETTRGTRREKRKRWVCGKVSACLALIRMMEEELPGPEGKVPQMGQAGGEGDCLTARNAEIAEEEGGLVEDGGGAGRVYHEGLEGHEGRREEGRDLVDRTDRMEP